MLNKIIDFSEKNKFIIISFFIFLILLSMKILKDIPVDAIPDLSDTQVIVYVNWNKSPKVIDDQITYPLIINLSR